MYIINDVIQTNVFFPIFFRNRRRSSVNLNSLGEETIKSRLPFDDYLGHGEYHDESKKDVELEMLTMLSVNQDNGEWIFNSFY